MFCQVIMCFGLMNWFIICYLLLVKIGLSILYATSFVAFSEYLCFYNEIN